MQVTNIPLPKVRSLDPGELAARHAAVVAIQQRRIAVVAVSAPVSNARAKPAATAVSAGNITVDHPSAPRLQQNSLTLHRVSWPCWEHLSHDSYRCRLRTWNRTQP